jgi:hypothetical protein
VAAAIVFALLVGFAAGVAVGRRNPAPSIVQRDVPVVGLSPNAVAAPSKRGRKAGLTEADFTPSDDILEKLRRASEGELDPAVLRGDGDAEPDGSGDAELPDPELTEAERRVLERLRREQDDA